MISICFHSLYFLLLLLSIFLHSIRTSQVCPWVVGLAPHLVLASFQHWGECCRVPHRRGALGCALYKSWVILHLQKLFWVELDLFIFLLGIRASLILVDLGYGVFFLVENLCWCVWWFSEGLGIASLLLLSLLFFLVAPVRSLLFSMSRCCEGLCQLFWSLFCPYRHLYMSLVSFPSQIGSIFAFSGVLAKKKILVWL